MKDHTTAPAKFFSERARSSAISNAFQVGVRPELGPYHPSNTFRSPFALDRAKSSWYLRHIEKCHFFHIAENSRGNLCLNFYIKSHATALLDSRLVALFDVNLAECVRRAKVILFGETVQEFVSPVHMELAKSTLQTTRQDAEDADAANAFSLPWFYTLKENRFLPLEWLQQRFSILHVFDINLGPPETEEEAEKCMASRLMKSDVECEFRSFHSCKTHMQLLEPMINLWIETASTAQDERTAICERGSVIAGVSSIVSDSLAMPGFAFGRTSTIGEDGKGDAMLEAGGQLASGFIISFFWRDVGAHSLYSLFVTSSDGDVPLFESVPLAMFRRVYARGEKWLVWSTQIPGNSWPPPGICIGSPKEPSPSGGSFVLRVANAEEGRELQMAASNLRFFGPGARKAKNLDIVGFF